MTATLPCPGCKTGTIVLEVELLMMGLPLECPQCNSVLAMKAESKDTLAKGVKSFNSTTQEMNQLHAKGSSPMLQ